MRRPTVRRTDPRLQIITEAIERLIPGSTPAFLSVQLTETFPLARRAGKNTWTGTPAGVAERIFTALYGRPRTEPEQSPLAQADAASDIAAEAEILNRAHTQLTTAPWHPLRPGDLVHIHYEASGSMTAFGETYIVGDAAEAGDPQPHLLSMVLLAHTLPDSTPEDDVKGMTGCYEAEASDDPLYNPWFEAGPQRLTIIRDGRVIHNGSAR